MPFFYSSLVNRKNYFELCYIIFYICTIGFGLQGYASITNKSQSVEKAKLTTSFLKKFRILLEIYIETQSL